MTPITQFVMLANGKGQRFVDAGYTDPKPLIKDTSGSPMWEIVPDAYGIVASEELMMITSKAIKDQIGEGKLKFIAEIEDTPGPLVSAAKGCGIMRGSGVFSPSLPVAFLDCDSFCTYWIKRATDHFFQSDADFGVLTYAGLSQLEDNKAKIFKVDSDHVGEAFDRRPGLPLSEEVNAVAGVYWFRSFDKFLYMYERHVPCMDGEPTFVNLIRSCLADGEKVVAHTVDYEDFFCLGTPKELQKWNELCA